MNHPPRPCVAEYAKPFVPRLFLGDARAPPKGTASNVRLSTDHTGAFLDIGGRPVELYMLRKIVIADGDEVGLTGQPSGDGLTGMGYRNLTRRIAGRRWILLGLAWRLLVICALTALVRGTLWFGEGEADFFTAFRRALALVLFLAIIVVALDRLFGWLLELEAWRRVKAGR